MKLTKEWYVPAPWGNIAVISWGSPNGKPVLMVHGRLDSAATFIPLVDKLSDKYYYVGIDLPGNGKSDPVPAGLPVWRDYYLGAINMVVEHLKWIKFLYVGHSMGCELGLLFNAIRPGMITKIVLLDPLPNLQRNLLINNNPEVYFKTYFEDYYDDYEKMNYYFKVYTKRNALDAVKRARQLDEEKAELVLERNLVALGDGHYRLSWDRRTALCISQNYGNEYYIELFSTSPPAILFNMSNGNKGLKGGIVDALKLLDALKTRINITVYELEGEHDAHLDPAEMVDKITQFLDEDFRKSKL